MKVSQTSNNGSDNTGKYEDPAVRLERRLARIERMLDEFFGAFLNAKFPHGQPTDRWGRRS
jgi:hypothetical protein